MFAQCFLPRSDRDARKVLDQPRDQPGDCVDNSWSAGRDYYLWSSFRSRTARCWSRSTVRASTSSTPLMWWVMWSFDHMDGDFKQWSYSWWIHLMISSMTLTSRWQQRFTRLCCLVWSLRSSLGITPSRARRTMRTACPVSSSSSASLRMEGVSQRSCKYDREPSSSSRLWLNNNFQVFSRQAVQMDALISAFVDEIKQVSVNNWNLVDLCLCLCWSKTSLVSVNEIWLTYDFRERPCTLRTGMEIYTTTTLPQRRMVKQKMKNKNCQKIFQNQIAWFRWQRCPEEGFPRVVWATN